VRIKKENIIKHKIDLWVVLAYTIIPILFFWSIIISDTTMVRGDGLEFYMTANDMLRKGIINGDIPLWNRFIASGTPFMADIQNKFFYPFTWLTMILPIKLGFKMYFLLHLSLGAIFMYFYLKCIKISKATSFLGGIIFMFSNLLVIRYEHINIVTCIIWTPMLLLLAEKLVMEKKIKYSILLGLVMGIQFLGGFPQTAIYTDIFVFGYYIIVSYNRESCMKDILKNILKQSPIFISIYIGIASIQIIPLAELIKFSGRNNISYEYFASFAYDLRMLVSMLFPTFWGDWATNLQKTMEFPMDIYVGIIPLCLTIYGMVFHNKEKKVKLLIFTMISVMLYACSPQIPLLAKMIYKIPILDSFRVQSRILFIFVIAMIILSMLTLDSIIKKNEFKRYFKLSLIILAVACIFMGVMISFAKSPIINGEYANYYGHLGLYKNTIFMLVLNVVISYIACKQELLPIKRGFGSIICFLLCLVVVADVYYVNTDNSVDIYRKNGIINGVKSEAQLISAQTEFLSSQADVDKYRYIVDNYTSEDFSSGPLGLKINNNIYNELMSIQSYITFENDNYLNMTDAANGKLITTNSMNSEINSSVLSMLSGKYVIKHKGANAPSFNKIIGKKSIYESNEAIKVMSSPQNPGVHPIKINIEKNKMLLVECEIDISNIPNEFITLDLCGSNGYDLAEANKELLNKVSEGSNKFKFIISTGDRDIPSDAVFRICVYDSEKKTEVLVKNLKIYEIQTELDQKLKSIYEDNDITIYENSQAKPIIYMPKQVINMNEDIEKIDNLKLDKDLANISYIKNFKDMNLEEVKDNIDITEVKNNSVSANVSVSEDAFINMSQCYYPGWNVYIDGKQSKLYKVNSLIQGVEIPKGTHKVEFKYQPKSMYIGMIISSATIIIILIILIRKKKIK